MEEEEKNHDLFSASVERAVQSISEAAKARPSTKLLDSEAAPKLDAPTRPFRRLKAPIKFPDSSESEADKKKKSTREKKRPLPGKKWRKRISREEIQLGESGIFYVVLF